MSDIQIISLLSYVLLPGCLVAGGVRRQCKLIEQYSATTIKGVMVLLLVVHHFVQKMQERGWYLEPMAWIGFLIVGWFFLTSGYGTFLSVQKKGFSLFWIGRIKRIWVPFVIAVTAQGLLKLFVVHEEGSVLQVITCALTLRTLKGSFMWYVMTQIVMYICFYLAYRFFKKPHLRFALMCVFVVLFDVIYIWRKEPAYKWVTCSCFPVGVLIGELKHRLQSFLSKHNKVWLIIFCCAVFGSIAWILSWRNARMEVFVQVPIASCAMAVLTSLLLFRSKIMHWLGTISYEIYITHLAMIEIAIGFWGLSWKTLLFAIAASVVFAWLVSKTCKVLIVLCERSFDCIFRKSRWQK